MTSLIRIVIGLLLIAHGAVHLLYLVPEANDPTYPFTLHSSWLIPEPARRPTAIALMTATVLGFALLALAVWGVPGLSTAWPAITLFATGASLALLVAFWDIRLGAGVAIDGILVTLAIVRPEWTDRLGSA